MSATATTQALRRAARRATALAACCGAVYVGPFLPSPVVWPKAASNLAKSASRFGRGPVTDSSTPLPLLAGGSLVEDEDDADGKALSEADRQKPKLVSVIIPVYNEGFESLCRLVHDVYAETTSKYHTELILVDGGCKDDSFLHLDKLVEGLELIHSVRIVTASGGRGPALARGAGAAQGDILLFLHADTRVPRGYDEVLRRELGRPQTAMCAFTFAVDRSALRGTPEEKEVLSKALSRLERATMFRSGWLWLPYGDQALAVTRATYREVGGIRPLAMMEDFDFASRVRRLALERGRRVATLPQQAYCSPRRWEASGVVANTCRNWAFVAAYVWGGVDPQRIFAWYYGSKPR